jgi:hypothetical protein
VVFSKNTLRSLLGKKQNNGRKEKKDTMFLKVVKSVERVRLKCFLRTYVFTLVE